MIRYWGVSPSFWERCAKADVAIVAFPAIDADGKPLGLRFTTLFADCGPSDLSIIGETPEEALRLYEENEAKEKIRNGMTRSALSGPFRRVWY